MRRFLRPFIWIVFTVFVLFWAYLCSRLGWPQRSWEAGALGALFLFVWLLPAVFWSLDRDEMGFGIQGLHWCAYLSMGYLSFLGVLVIARDAFLWPASWWGSDWARAAFAPAATSWILVLAAAALGVGVFRALVGSPQIREVEVPVAGLPAALEGFRIAQISDLHIGTTIRQHFVERVVRSVNGLSADLVAITGDLADGMPADLAERTASLAQLEPRGRVFYVIGNHECYWDAQKWILELARLGAIVLLNSAVSIEHRGVKILIGGVTDPAYEVKPDPTQAGPVSLMAAASFRLLLAHQPQIAPVAARAGFNLQLSGHTHAGQFFPWTLIARRVHRQLLAGLSREGKMWVYVSAGTGTWGPPVRLGTSSEITLLRLVRESSA